MDVKWYKWCRLCARSDTGESIDVASNTNIKTAIGKYFWVDIKLDDFNKYVCQDCYALVNSLLKFTERVSKVQAMYFILNSKQNLVDPNEVRSQFDLHDEDWEHIVKAEKKVNDNDYSQEIEEIESDDQMDASPVDETTNDADKFKSFSDGFKEKEQFKPKANENASAYDSSDDSDVGDSKELASEAHQPVNEDEMEVEEQGIPAAFPDTSNQSHSDEEHIPRKTQSCEGRKKMIESYSSKYLCNSCGKSYKNVASYRKHLESHNIEEGLPEFVCDDCGKVLATERQLSLHKRVHLPLEEKLTVQCPHCHKKYINETVLKQHILHMHNEQSYVCEECGMTLKRLSSLKDHKLTHSDVFAFKCDSCDKGFKNKARLKAHMDAVHSTKTYPCSECDLKLNSKRTLKMHMLVHSSEKSYPCNFCGAEFKRGKSLKNHLIIHAGLRPYVCNFCNKSFTNGSNCRAHKRKIHPVELEAEEAAGLKNKGAVVPNLYELRASESIREPRSSTRNRGGITPKMRALLVAAEQLQSAASTNTTKGTNKNTLRFKLANENGEEIEEFIEIQTENDSESYKNDMEDESLVFEVIDESDL